MRANRGIAGYLEGECKRLKKKRQSAFWKNGEVMFKVWKDKTGADDKCDP
jgi:hypothetical protein